MVRSEVKNGLWVKIKVPASSQSPGGSWWDGCQLLDRGASEPVKRGQCLLTPCFWERGRGSCCFHSVFPKGCAS